MRKPDLQTIALDLFIERAPSADVGCTCNDCGRIAMVPRSQLMDHLKPKKVDPRTPVWDIGRHLKCSACDSKDVSTDLKLPPFTVIDGFSDGKEE